MSEPISPDELASILRNVADGITAQGPDGILVYANDAAARLCGISSAQELLALSGAELLERFEIIDEDGSPMPLDRLPNRRAFAEREEQEGVLGYRLRPSGDERWSILRSTPVLADSGEIRLVINVFHDVTHQRQAEERIGLLAETGMLFSAGLDYAATLAELSALLVPRFADFCIVDVLEEASGGPRQVVITHRDPEREELLQRLRRRYPPEENDAHPVTEVLRTGEPFLVEDARDSALSRAAVDAEHLALYRALAATSYVVVPLEARGRMLGTISLGTGESGRRFTTINLELAREIARRAALALDNALLFRAASESYAQLDTLLLSAPVAIGFWDRELRFVRVNDALAQLNRQAPEAHIGKTLAEVIPVLAVQLEPLYRRVLETGEPVVHEESTDKEIAGPGDARHWLSSYYPVRGNDGETSGVGGVIMEITGQKRADARLRLLAEAGELFSSSFEREEILQRVSRVLVPQIADACNIYLADGDVLDRVAFAHADPELERLMAGMPNRYVVGPAAPAALRHVVVSGEPLLAATLDEDLIESLEEIGLDRELFERVGSHSMMFVPFVSRGETLGVITLGARDAGRYTEVDLELAQELAGRASAALDNARLVGVLRRRAQAAQALEFVGDGVFLVGDDGIVRLWNPAAARITGVAEADVVGRRAEAALEGWPLGKGERAQTFPVDGPAGELWLSLTAAEFASGTVYAFRDLTEERAVEQLKSDFVSTVSHELRTPLAAIYGAAMTLQRSDVELNATQEAGMLGVIAGESERLARIVNDILLASRLDSGAATVEIGSTDATELARAVLAAAEAHLPPDVELTLTAPEPGPQVAADPDGLRQVLVNLVENAVKYSPNGGRVQLELQPVGGSVRFAVSDSGLGIPPSEHERIFEKFFRLDPNLSRGVGGTGLGLYISREIVRRMGGRIRVESESGRGSTFSFELPLA
ncbi:MAG: PAS domain-containing protein [Gaiellaceae bacterium]